PGSPPARRAPMVRLRPDALVQRGNEIGVEQQNLAFARAQLRRALGNGALEQCRARGANCGSELAPPAQERAVQRIHVGIYDGADEPVLFRWCQTLALRLG